MNDAGPDGSTPTMCAADGHCGDASLFCSQWRCRPGEPGTDARGCIDLGSPCAAGVDCDEDEDTCSMSWCTEGRDGCLVPGDCDGDGARNMPECSGDDCDDDDGDSFPGNPEICDATGHDEDCNSETLAGEADGDRDGDGYIASTCCNGDACGDDCDDGLREVFPGARELCNGYDDDCDGTIDGATAFCPTGVCVAGRCRAESWMVTLGNPSDDPLGWDSLLAATTGNDGNIYAIIAMGAGGTLGGEAVGPGMHLLALGADGRFLWSAPTDRGEHMVEDPTRTGIVVGDAQNGTDPGIRLRWFSSADGTTLETLRADIPLPSGRSFLVLSGIVASRNRIIVAWETLESTDYDPHITVFNSAGGATAHWSIEDATRSGRVRSIASSPAGEIALLLEHDGPLTIGSTTVDAGVALLRLSSTLTPLRVQTAPTSTRAVGIADDLRVAYAGTGFATLLRPDGTVEATFDSGAEVAYRTTGFDERGGWVVAGTFSGTFDFGRGPVTAEGVNDGFVALYDLADRRPINAHVIGGSGSAGVDVMSVDGYAGILVGGTFLDQISFSSDRFTSRGGVDVFLARVAD